MANRGNVWWNERNTWDAEAGAAPAWLAKRDGKAVCGFFSLRSPEFDGMPSHWLTYLAVDDLD
ncbi:MAG: hypothetical protein QF893_02300 [Alphaproteobacteria bacterium]|nr:hypothetical protein [Alphaproteobacteria bacterium]